jgi:hypothetical protein
MRGVTPLVAPVPPDQSTLPNMSPEPDLPAFPDDSRHRRHTIIGVKPNRAATDSGTGPARTPGLPDESRPAPAPSTERGLGSAPWTAPHRPKRPSGPVPAPRPIKRAATAPITTAGRDSPIPIVRARELLATAEDRDTVFLTLLRAARARARYAGLLTVQGGAAIGRVALAEPTIDVAAINSVLIARRDVGVSRGRLEPPAAYRTDRVGRSEHRFDGAAIRRHDAADGVDHADRAARPRRRARSRIACTATSSSSTSPSCRARDRRVGCDRRLSCATRPPDIAPVGAPSSNVDTDFVDTKRMLAQPEQRWRVPDDVEPPPVDLRRGDRARSPPSRHARSTTCSPRSRERERVRRRRRGSPRRSTVRSRACRR